MLFRSLGNPVVHAAAEPAAGPAPTDPAALEEELRVLFGIPADQPVWISGL